MIFCQKTAVKILEETVTISTNLDENPTDVRLVSELEIHGGRGVGASTSSAPAALWALLEVLATVRRYAARNLPSSAWRRTSVAHVGIHVRAGDVMRCDKRTVGYTIPHRSYFERAMSRFVDHRSQLPGYPVLIQFVVASDNLAWVKSPAGLNFSSVSDKEVIYSMLERV